MKTLSLCTPVWGRPELTEILFRERVKIQERAYQLGVQCVTVVIGDDENIQTARNLGFDTIEAPNVLGAKYNSGHEWAVREGFDFSFQVNSDQVFAPRLLVAITESPDDQLIQTRWLTAVHRDGKRSITTYNPKWSMKAYPLGLLRKTPRPCPEHYTKDCDTGVHEGVVRANPGVGTHEIEVGPLETIQFESKVQLTSWERHQKVARLTSGSHETQVPWAEIAAQHSDAFVEEMKSFYKL